MLEIIIGILGVMVAILGYATFNLLRKNEKAEDIIISQTTFIKKFEEQVQISQLRLDQIDKKGTFQGDDEIGWFFNEVKILQNSLSNFNPNT